METIDNDFTNEEKIKIKYCENYLILIEFLNYSFINKDIKIKNKANDDVYFLYKQIDINQILSKNDEKEKD